MPPPVNLTTVLLGFIPTFTDEDIEARYFKVTGPEVHT